MCKFSIMIMLMMVLLVTQGQAATKFDAQGTAIVDGKPFFPIGIFLYSFNSDILAEIHQQGFNTVLYAVTPKDLDTLKAHGLMCVPYAREEWLAVKDHPAILSWYLADEPEGHDQTPEQMRKEYERVRSIDPTRPIGLCHYLFAAFAKYKDSSDYVMSDVYPVIANRSQPVTPLAVHIDELHKIHGKNFPVWPVIQIFGGQNTDAGIWAEPTPAEVRCMTYLALAHGGKAMLFFSYWPQLPRTWAEVSKLTRELHRLTPFLTLPSKELPIECPDKSIHTRCIKIGNSGILIAVNVDPTFKTVKLNIPNSPSSAFALPFENRRISLKKGEFSDRFMPYEVHIYQWGETPGENSEQ